MSVLIKGMIMSSCCGECFLCEPYSIGCRLLLTLLDREDYMRERRKDCSLVEVKEPHGRLIDELRVIDAIHERLEVLRTHEVFVRKHGDIDLLGVMPYIAKIPTVIKAEGSEDE